jgi:hypothetical protein
MSMAQRSILPKSQQQVRHCKRPSAHDQTADPPPNRAAAQKFLDRFSMHVNGLAEQWARGPLFRSAHRLVQCNVHGLATSKIGPRPLYDLKQLIGIREPHRVSDRLLGADQKLERPARGDGSCAIMDRRGEARVQSPYRGSGGLRSLRIAMPESRPPLVLMTDLSLVS